MAKKNSKPVNRISNKERTQIKQEARSRIGTGYVPQETLKRKAKEQASQNQANRKPMEQRTAYGRQQGLTTMAGMQQANRSGDDYINWAQREYGTTMPVNQQRQIRDFFRKRDEEQENYLRNYSRAATTRAENQKQEQLNQRKYRQFMDEIAKSAGAENQKKEQLYQRKFRDYLDSLAKSTAGDQQKQEQLYQRKYNAYQEQEKKRQQLGDMSLASFENYAAEYKRQAAGNPAMQKSDNELFRDWTNLVYNERGKGTWDNGDDPLMMSDDGLRNYQIRLGKQIADIQGTIDEIDRQLEDRAAWYPDNAMQDWNDLHASMEEGEYTGGVSIADILSEYGIDPSAEQIQRKARDYYNNQFKTMRPGDTEEQRALNREILFDSVYGTGSGDGLYEMVTENMTDEERAMFDEKLDYIIEDMQNPY